MSINDQGSHVSHVAISVIMWVKLATLDSLMQDEDDPCVYIQDMQLTQTDHKKNLDPNNL